MRRSGQISALSLLGMVVLALVAVFPGSASGESDHSTASATLRDANGNQVGRVVFASSGSSVVVAARVERVPAGFRGFHVHAVGSCVAPFTGVPCPDAATLATGDAGGGRIACGVITR